MREKLNQLLFMIIAGCALYGSPWQRCQLVRFTRKSYRFLRFTRAYLQAYDAILTDIYDFCRFKLTIIPRFIFELLSVCNDTSYAS